MNNDKQLCIGFTHFDPRFAFFWSIVSHCAQEEAERLGVKLISKPAPYVTDQIIEIQELLEQKVDALLITPIESGHPGLIDVIKTVNAAGVPVVALDSGVGGGQVMSTVRSDNIKGEEVVAEYIFERLGGKGKVVHLQGDLKVEVGAHRSEGFHNVLSRYPEIELVFEAEGNWYRDRGAELTQQALARHPDIQAVIAANDLTALGVSDVIAKAGRTKEILVAGFDALPEALLSIYAGQMTATIQQDADGMAREALQAAIQGIRGEAVPSLLLTKVELITIDNLLKTAVDGLHMLPGVLRNLEEQKLEISKANVILEQHRDQLEKLVADRTYELTRQQYILDTFMDNVPDRIYFKDTQGRMTRTNRAFAIKLGAQDSSELIGKSDFDFFPAEQAEIKYQQEQEIIKTGQPILGLEEPDGIDLWALTTKMPLRDEKGIIIGTFGISKDITERKQAEETLARERSLLRTLIDHLPDYVYIKDTQARFTVANRQTALNMGGADPAELIGKDDFDFYPRELAAAYYADDMAVIQSGQPLLNKEELAVGVDGRQHWLLTTKIPLKDSEGKIAGLVGVGIDTTERKQVEEALARERNLLRTLIDSIPDQIFAKDTAGRFTLVNAAQAHLRDIANPDEMIGKSDFDFYPRELAEQFRASEQAILVAGQSMLEHEEPNLDAADNEIWTSTTKVPVRNQQGQIIGLVGVSRDVTERRNLLAEQQRRALQLQAVAEVSRVTQSILALDELLPQAANLVCERFNLYYVGIFMLDQSGQWAVLRAGTGEAGQQMLQAGHKLEIGGSSMIGACLVNRQARVALDVGDEAVRFINPLLPDTRSEMALPLISRDRVIGAVTVQSDQPAAFTPDEITILQTMADQIGNAIENARLYEQSGTALQEVDALNRRLTGQAWEAYTRRTSREQLIRITDDNRAAPAPLLNVDENLSAGQISIEPQAEQQAANITAPIMLRGQPIGALRVRTPDTYLSEDIQIVLTSVASHIAQAVENARLLDETERRAQRERTINEINRRVRQTVNVDAILKTAVNELGRSFQAARVFARINPPDQDEPAPTDDGHKNETA